MRAPEFRGYEYSMFRGPKDHVDMRLSYSGSKAQDQVDTRNHMLSDCFVHVRFWGPNILRFLVPNTTASMQVRARNLKYWASAPSEKSSTI